MKALTDDHDALIQTGYVCYGTGATEDDARQDAARWLEDPDDADEAPMSTNAPNHGVNDGDLVVIHCTEAFHREVQANGGDLCWEDTPEGVCLPAERLETDDPASSSCN